MAKAVRAAAAAMTMAIAALLDDRGGPRAGGAARPLSTRRSRRRTSRSPRSARRSTTRPNTRPQLSAAERRKPDRSAGRAGRRPRPPVHRRPLLERRQRLRRRRAALRLAEERLRARAARCCSPRATAPRSRGGCGRRKAGPEAPPRDRDHQRLGPGRRTDVLVRRAGARQGRLRRADLRPAGPGPERHARARRPTNSEGVPAQTDGRPFFDGTEDAIDFFLSSAEAPVRAGAELRNAARATPPSRTNASQPASTPPTTRSGSC